MQISGLSLRVSDVTQSQLHYTEVWPEIIGHSEKTAQSARLTLAPTAGAAATPQVDARGLPAYWKFSIFTDHVEATRARLLQLGWSVTEPVQFLDIGYLCHTADSDGHSIELLQRQFVPPLPRPIEHPPTLWFRGADTLGLITLRIASVEPNLSFYQAVLGMKLLAVMDIDDGRPDPFTLYFLAFTEDEPPNANPRSIENREWLYHRPYTVLELQSYWPVEGRTQRPLWHPPASGPGLSHVEIEADTVKPLVERAQQLDVRISYDNKRLILHAPEGHRFMIHEQP